MNLNHLAVFHAVAEEGSMSKGARRLLVSQPAVSKQVSELEKSVGLSLFDRQARGVRLTEAGTLLLGYARQLFGVANQAERAIEELRGLGRGRLAVAASTTIGVYLLPEIFVCFRLAHPGIQMHMEIASSEVVRARLLEGTVDIGLTENYVDDDHFDSTPFMKDNLIAIAPVGHPLTRKRSVTAAMLCREPFVVRETGSGSKSLVERALDQRGLSIKPVMSLGSTEAIKHAVAAGVGVAIVSGLAVGLEIGNHRLARIRASDLAIQRTLYMVKLCATRPSPAVQAFCGLLQEAASIPTGKKLVFTDNSPRHSRRR